MAEPPVPGRPDWRQGKSSGPSRSAGRRPWQQKEPQEQPLPQPSGAPANGMSPDRTTMLFGLGVLLVLMLGAFVAWALIPRTLRPAYMALLGAGYEENLALPHNHYAWRGFTDIQNAASEHLPVGTPVHLTANKAWEDAWQKVQQESNGRTVVLFLGLHGMADANGAYLFLDDPQGKKTLALKDVLVSLADLEKKDPKRKILLILEPAVAGAYWPAGLVRNDFVRRLREQEELIKKEHPNLLILCASDTDETSWASEEWRQTVFTHYLLEALQAGGPAGSEQPITARQLHEAVKEKVEEWAKFKRGVKQTPILLGNGTGSDFELVRLAPRPADAVPMPGKDYKPSGTLKGVWEQTAKLRNRQPFPAAYSPQRWRYFLDLALRYEQLERAGYPGLDRLHDRLKRAHADIIAEGRCDLATGALGRALAMPPVLGLRLPYEDRHVEAVIDKVWPSLTVKGGEKEPKRLLVELADEARNRTDEPLSQKLLRGQVHQAVLRVLAEKYKEGVIKLDRDRDKAGKLLEFVKKQLGDQERPAETHLLVMLLQDLAQDHCPNGATVAAALEVRLLAEQAALAAPAGTRDPYGEAVFAWVKSEVAQADKLRRKGEDYLIASRTPDHDQARKLLDDAAKGYKRALQRAEIVRAALDIRDRGLADLPYYAWWVAQQRNGHAEAAPLVQTLAHELKELADRLQEQPQSKTDKEMKELLDVLVKSTEGAQAAHDDLQKRLRSECTRLQPQQLVPEAWHDMQALLALPMMLDDEKLDVENRAALLANSRLASQRFEEGAELPNAGKVPARPGDRVPQDMAGATLVPYRGLLPDGFREAIEQGPERLAQRLKEARNSPDREKARPALAAADLLCRALPATAPPDVQAFSGPLGLRHLRLYELLLWQAERTGRDHWFAPQHEKAIVGETYYIPAAKTYLGAAAAVAAKGLGDGQLQNSLADELKKWQDKFREASRLTALWRGNGVWTGPVDFSFTWELGRDGDMFFQDDDIGVPVASLELVDGATPAIGNPQLKERIALKGLKEPAHFTLSRGKAGGGSAEVPVEGLVRYRGQQIRLKKTLNAPEVDLIVRHVRPREKPAVAFQLEKNAGHGSVCIVLDCSGSMNKRFANGTRFEAAVDALKAALRDIPEDTPLSVMAFIEEPDSTDKDPKFRYPMLRDPGAWEKSALNRVIGRAKALGSEIKDGRSPIAQALLEAKKQGFDNEDDKGPRIIVALTDGDDNFTMHLKRHYDADNPLPVFNEKDRAKYDLEVAARVRKLLKKEFDSEQARRLGEPDYEIHVICFNDDKDKSERERARKQFEGVKQFYRKGSFIATAEVDDVRKALDRSMRPRLYLHGRAQPVVVPATYRSEQVLNWKELPANDRYRPGMPIPSDKHIVLVASGDRLLVTRTRTGFRRGLLGEWMKGLKFSGNEQPVIRPQDHKVLTMPLHFHREGKERLEQVITIEIDEGTPAPDVFTTIQQRQPEFVWLETTHVQGSQPGLVQWGPRFDYPAPAYQLTIDGWQLKNGLAAKTRVWWSDKIPEDAGELIRDVPVVKPGDPFKELVVDLAGTTVRIEAVRADMEKSPGGKVPEKCVVVQTSWDKTKARRFYVELLDRLPDADEHRYYSSVGRVTSYFWLGAEPPRQLSFRIIAVDRLDRPEHSVTFTLDHEIDALNRITPKKIAP